MKTKEDNAIIRNLCGWEKITTKGFVEVWKTPTKFLTCYKYGGIFIFCNSEEEARNNVENCEKMLELKV